MVILFMFCSCVKLGNKRLTANTTCDKNNLFNSIKVIFLFALATKGLILPSNMALILLIRFLLDVLICSSSNIIFHNKTRFCLFLNCVKLLIIYIIN